MAPPTEASPGPAPSAPPPSVPAAPISQEELEETSNGYFSKIYKGELSVQRLIEIMKEFAAEPKGSWKHEVYSCMIQNLFDECRFFPKYPPTELVTTGELFGSLIRHVLVCPATEHAEKLGLALRCVLEALRRPLHSKMFRFGILALEQFLVKLPSWPRLCHHLTQVEHLGEAYPTYMQYAREILEALPEDLWQSTSLTPEVLAEYSMPECPEVSPPVTTGSTNGAVTPGKVATTKNPPVEGYPPSATVPPAGQTPSKESSSGSNKVETSQAKSKAAPAVPSTAASANGVQSLTLGGTYTVDSLLSDPELIVEKPPEWFSVLVTQLFNSLAKDNVDQKAEEFASKLTPDHFPWLAYYVVKNPAAKEVNFHSVYVDFFEKLKQPQLLEMITNSTYDCLRVLLRSVDQAVVSTSHRTVLKNLGFWLGQITLARNKPLKSKQMDLKSHLLDAYENGRLTAVLPLVCKILEGIQLSKVYKLPNPWTTAIMSLLAEIHDVPNLRTNLMFEVEVLCNHLCIKLHKLKRSKLLAGKRPPANSNDLIQKPDVPESAPLSGKVPEPGSQFGHSLSGAAPTGSAMGVAGGHGQDRGGDGSYVIPNLNQHMVISPNIALFQVQPNLRQLVPLAVDRSIREVVSAGVERSVTISCLTTREIVTKDFATEPDENVLKKAAQLMVSSMAGALALVTCREPLRVSLTNNLRMLLQASLSQQDQAGLEQVVQLVSADNLELGCSLIEKAVVDKALKDVEDSIAPAVQARRAHHERNPGAPYFDPAQFNPNSKWPQGLPDILRPKAGPLSAAELKVYKDFLNLGASRKRLSLQGATGGGAPSFSAPSSQGGNTQS